MDLTAALGLLFSDLVSVFAKNKYLANPDANQFQHRTDFLKTGKTLETDRLLKLQQPGKPISSPARYRNTAGK